MHFLWLEIVLAFLSLTRLTIASRGPSRGPPRGPGNVHTHWRLGYLWETGSRLHKWLTDSDFRKPESGEEACVHGPGSRHCWCHGLGIDSNHEVEWPDTGNVVKYDFEISRKTLAPDGVPKDVIAINGQFPGPTITADWGDTIEVNVKNKLDKNGTGIHWHGVRQFESNHMDGTGGITECPIAIEETRTYRFKATQYGTSWYHSHYSVQYGEGLLGGIVIRGPATADYDIDLGWYPFMDWFYRPIFDVNREALHVTGPEEVPKADNLLINGTMKTKEGGHKYAETTLKPGKRHLLRLINTGVNNHVHVSLDDHTLEVIAADFVPIVPYKTKSLSIAVGQRYDVIIDANQDVSSYWLRVSTGGGRCDGPNANAENIRSVFHYSGSPLSQPPKDKKVVKLDTGCDDEENIVPWAEADVPKSIPKSLDLNFTNTATDDGLVQWLINDNPMYVDLSLPVLKSVMDGNTTFQAKQNVIKVGERDDDWSYWVIQQNIDQGDGPRIPHPIHLHGHDFYILDAAANATWSGDTSRLNFKNPPRRDTANLPAAGYLVLAFQTSNPGAWLMHCHIPFHLSAGFGMQFLERGEEVKGVVEYGGGFAGDEVEGFMGRLGRQGMEVGCGKWGDHVKKFFPEGFQEGDTLV
ncbi:multicopper oxidase [Sporormia fimetaria CBS 119925]|uniref:Multicopper oxidase n=1 Tax=Sporormia fimetaria CBS 119925 TaxID=1340428 RepID=A0A6A6V490_9PLEO|nr:multicopper oxidase [Sporormia fimetaria CBS 119925]